ncbi:unnamed protein product [Peronospora farinosa]|uniref:Uncharacterized protein n=1 Tax=Peronospora farinosa TaxID=134698 RepID=A0AAV0UKI4_9STRA|nr:unnamed protein product [Peronospora farinosa]
MTDVGEEQLTEKKAQATTLRMRLKLDIHQILQSDNPERFRDLLTFLTSTVPDISHNDQERSAITDITDATNIDVIQLQQQHHFEPCILQQWRTLRHENDLHQPENNRGAQEKQQDILPWSHGCHGVRDARPDQSKDHEISGQSQLVVHVPQTPNRFKPNKRARPTTPDDTERQKGQTKNKHTALVLKKGKGNAGGKAVLTRPEIPLLTNGPWQEMWQSWSETWHSASGNRSS